MTASDASEAGSGVTRAHAPLWLLFACDEHFFAIPLALVREIVPPQRFTRLPGCAPEVCGLIGLRGRVITVFDLGAALGLRPSTCAADYRLLLVEQGDRVAGVVVEAVSATEPLRMDALAPDDRGRRFADALGMGEWNGARVLALDIDHILGRLLG
jgi:purine-binding chemotaxis protein CheW